MRYIICLLITFFTLTGCSNEGINKETKDELKKFIQKYNETLHITEKDHPFKMSELPPANLNNFEKQNDGLGYQLVLDDRTEDQSTLRYTLECRFDNNRNIIGYSSFGMGKGTNYNKDGSIKFSDKGIVASYIVAKTLNLDVSHLRKQFQILTAENEEEITYEDNGYKVTMKANKNIGSVSFTFMKIN